MLSIGLNRSTTVSTAYFRCLSLLSECLKRRTEPSSSFVWSHIVAPQLSRNSRTTDTRGAAQSVEFLELWAPRRAACAL